MKSSPLVVLVALTAIAIIGFLLYPKERARADLDAFAACLADAQVVMYGAAWCSHCQNEKQAFGDAFRLVPYVECPDEPAQCLAAGVNGYPTWIFPDGRVLEGEQGLVRLAEASKCALPLD